MDSLKKAVHECYCTNIHKMNDHYEELALCVEDTAFPEGRISP